MTATRRRLGRELLVVVVDHDQSFFNAISDHLSTAECGAVHLSSTASPWRVRELRPDLIILNLPSFPRRKKDFLHYFEQGAPVIVVSDEQALEFDHPDVLDFLPLPLDLWRLREDIERVRMRPHHGSRRSYPPLDASDLGLFQEFLHTYSGLNFDERNSKILERSLCRRMRAVAASDYLDYFDYLVAHRETRHELKRLLSLLTIGETFFFRYTAHFDALADKVIPELIERNRQARTLRIWSAGCSTGEEPYSLAIMLHERFPQLHDWKVDLWATDINKFSLARARVGQYNARSVRLVDPALLTKWFAPQGELYCLDPQLCKRIDFTYLNLQTGPYPDEPGGPEGSFDLILCRNVMIYFRLDTTRTVVERLGRALRPGGYFFMGHAETLLNISTTFDRHHYKGGFYYQLKRTALPAAAAAKAPAQLPERNGDVAKADAGASAAEATAREISVKATESRPDLVRWYEEAEAAFREENYRTAYQKYDMILKVDPEHHCALVGKGFICANEGKFREALLFCEQSLRKNDLCVSAYFLRGLIHEQMQESAAAVDSYRKVLLLDINFIMAHYYLGQLYRRQGKVNDARRQFKNVVRLVEREVSQAIIPYSGGLSAAALLERCRLDLDRLE